MLALVRDRASGWAAAQRPVPNVSSANEVLVRIRAVGICGTDLGIYQGDYYAAPGIVLGHEAAGEVVAIGAEVRRLAPGVRVAIDPTYFCGECRMCQTGRPNHCVRKVGTETGVTRDGCFTAYYTTEERFLYPLDDHVSFSAATLTEPLSCVLTGVNRLRLIAGLRAIVLGGGPIGALYAAALSFRGFEGTIVEPAPCRRAVLNTLALPGWSVTPEFSDLIGDDLDIVVDTTAQLAEQTIERLACGGQLLLVGLKPGRAVIDPGRLADRSIGLIGSIDGIDTFSDALSLIATNRIPVDRLVTHSLPLTDWQSALSLLGVDSNARGGRLLPAAMKVILVP